MILVRQRKVLFFNLKVSFNIDEKEKVVHKRKTRTHRARRRKNEETQTDTACPGCGTGIDEKEFLDCITSFAIGAHDHSINDPVRVRFVQTLRNEVAALPTPKPREGWILEITHRIEKQMHILLNAERRRMKSQGESKLRKNLKLNFENVSKETSGGKLRPYGWSTMAPRNNNSAS